MTRLTDCPSCELGDHSHHVRTVQAVPEGMYGGAVCPCKGECEDNKAQKLADFRKKLGLTHRFR